MATQNQDNEKILTYINHLSGIFIGFLGPLIFMLASENKTVKAHAKAALNWQLSVLIYLVISGILTIILIGVLGIAIFTVLNVIFCIIATIKASEGKIWKYPISIQFFK